MRTNKAIEERIRGLCYQSSNKARGKILSVMLRTVTQDDASNPRDIQRTLWRNIMKMPLAKLALLVVAIGVVAIAINHLGGSLDGTGVAWADVVQNLERHLKANDAIHLVITDRRPVDDFEFGAVVKKEEIWMQRPYNMRREVTFQVNDTSVDMTFSSGTSIENEEGGWDFSHDKQRWGFEDGDLMNVKHRISKRELRKKNMDSWLMGRYYAIHNWKEGTYNTPVGDVVGHTELNGEGVTIYDFREFEGVRHKCWLRDKDARLLRMEVYIAEETMPAQTYEILSDEVAPHPSIFTPAIPKDYTSGQVLGYEDQPQLIHSRVVAVVQDAESAKFYRLNLDRGQTREDAIAEAIATDEPAVEVKVEQPTTMRIIAKQPEGSDYQKPASRLEIGFGTIGVHRYGVKFDDEDDPGNSKIVIMPRSDYAGQGSIVFETLNYRTDYSYCKVAFDADGDGLMDAWCQVPSQEVVAGWLEEIKNK